MSSTFLTGQRARDYRDAYLHALGLPMGPVWIGLRYNGQEAATRRVTPVVELHDNEIVWADRALQLHGKLPGQKWWERGRSVAVEVVVSGTPAGEGYVLTHVYARGGTEVIVTPRLKSVG